jgi:chromosome segregation ATPase
MIRKIILPIVACALLAGIAAAQQSLADAAREARKNKRTTSNTNRVFTNDSLGISASASSAASSAPASASAETPASANGTAAPKGDAAKQETEDDKQKAADEAKAKIEKAKAELAQLQRELDVLQRENRLRGAAFYADAGNRLRDERKFAEEDRKYQADIAAKQKAIANQQATLERLRDEARRAGVPAGQLQ